jgi:transcriptional regulator GlxA family with amidase domain
MKIAFLAYPDMEELDFVGPWEVFSAASKLTEAVEACFVVSATKGNIRCAKGLTIVSETAYADCPDFDAILIPGGFGSRAQRKDAVLRSFLKERLDGTVDVLSVCTGSLILAEFGYLDGKSATTHWSALEQLRAYPKVTVKEERTVHDGRFWSSAGVSAGIDLALEYIASRLGEAVAESSQFYTEYYPVGTIYGNPQLQEGAPRYLKARLPQAL